MRRRPDHGTWSEPWNYAVVPPPLLGAVQQGDDGDNVLTGDPDSSNEIYGEGGNDTITGGDASDVLLGGSGNDRISGGRGRDELYGGDNDDVLMGGRGDDTLYGGTGTDQLIGGPGSDFLVVHSSEISAGDLWNGSAGNDRVSVDVLDGPHAIDLAQVRILGLERFALNENDAVTIAIAGRQLAGFDMFTLLGIDGTTPDHVVNLTTGGVIGLRAGSSFYIPILNLSDHNTTLDASAATLVTTAINGGARNDTIRASAAGTHIDGGGGDDLLYGGDGADVLDGGGGINMLEGGAGDDTLIIGLDGGKRPTSAFIGGEGYDTITIVAGDPDRFVDLSRSTISGIEAIDAGGSGLRAMASQLDGLSALHAGEVRVTSGGRIRWSGVGEFTASSVTLSNSGNNITLDGTGFVSTVIGGTGNDIVQGTRFFRADGGDGDDRLLGSDAVNMLVGGAGADILRGGGAADVLYAQSDQGPLAMQAATVIDRLYGDDGDDYLYSSGGSAELYGGKGNDFLSFDGQGGAAGLTCRIDGGSGDDSIYVVIDNTDLTKSEFVGGAGFDALYLNGLNGGVIDLTTAIFDVEKLVGAAFRLNVAQINDLSSIEFGSAYIADGGIVDVSHTAFIPGDGLSNATAFFLSDFGNEFIGRGIPFELYVVGGAGDDLIIGGGTSNSLHGGNGNDVLRCLGTFGEDDLDGGAGIDWVDYSDAVSAVTVDLGIFSAQDTGAAGQDLIYNVENLRGSTWNDTLAGNYMANVIAGGMGADTLTGAGDADSFAYAAIEEFGVDGASDTITDFSHAEGDRIDLSTIDPDTALAGDQHFTFVGGRAFSGNTALYEVRIEAIAGGFIVQGDIDHDRIADFSFTVDSATALVKADFIL